MSKHNITIQKQIASKKEKHPNQDNLYKIDHNYHPDQ